MERHYRVEVDQRWRQVYRVPASTRAEARAKVLAGAVDAAPAGIAFMGRISVGSVRLERAPDGRAQEG